MNFASKLFLGAVMLAPLTLAAADDRDVRPVPPEVISIHTQVPVLDRPAPILRDVISSSVLPLHHTATLSQIGSVAGASITNVGSTAGALAAPAMPSLPVGNVLGGARVR